MFTTNAYPFYKNDKSAQQSGGIGPVLRLRLEEKRAFKEATQVNPRGHLFSLAVKSIMNLKYLASVILSSRVFMVSLKSIS